MTLVALHIADMSQRRKIMSRYYDYDTLCKGMHDVVLKNGALHRCIDDIKILDLPTADVVEVGKCKDCIHHGSFLPWCKIFDKRMNDDDYCSRFDRK